ncbi:MULTISPECIES: hypothetical protein [unclassified Pseudomonas]|uniref:hypothetical protein n=1 Tax=unclassified Pseudomonas TaxID=196821 RepID=UPI00083911DF|nr:MULTISPECIES: hypothetical protein [unclassified Pseudomonas]QIH08941.1 hypothetical protein ATY02_20480 [Pseudomonas sp. BIOMIG1BAC]
MRGDEELVAKLSARLTEEIENLPNDGKDHELVIKIKGNHGNINLGTQNFEINSTKQPPPQGSDRSRECPQCGKVTWRYTKLCMHCDYNLHNHDQVEAEERERREAEEYKKRLDTFMLKLLLVLIFIAVFSYAIKDYLPATMRIWSMVVTGVSGLFAFVVLASSGK